MENKCPVISMTDVRTYVRKLRVVSLDDEKQTIQTTLKYLMHVTSLLKLGAWL